MKEAVIAAAARTPIGRAWRGAFNNTKAPTLGGHVIRAAVQRAGLEPGEVDDVILGCAMQMGTTGWNIGRTSALAAGLPATTGAMSLDRQCSSGMIAIANAAKQVLMDNTPVVVAAGLEAISLVQNDAFEMMSKSADETVTNMNAAAYMPMLQTAETVAERYQVSREVQDEFALQSQQRTAAAQQGGKFDEELAPLNTTKVVTDKETRALSYHETLLERDEGSRP